MNYQVTMVAIVTALGLSACQGGGGEEPQPEPEDFVSDDPFGGGGGDEGDPAGTGGDSDGGGEGGDDNGGDEEGDGGDELALSEADIIQLEGDTLYALSSYSGLSVVDISDPDNMRALGSWEADARPFEMYVDGGHAFVMFNDYYNWYFEEGDGGGWVEQSTSRLVALDATDPANIEVTGEFEIPGRIQDSRRVGDILYLVTLEDGWCWGCDGEQKTIVTSLDVSDESNPTVIDELEYYADDDNWDWERSVESTTERMYLASRTWGWEGVGSAIDVVDISAGDGTLTAGARVGVEGSVFSRWQMDEYEGVLRVISQRGWDEDPLIETFTIESPDSIVPLGSGNVSIPMPESLRSARFDGDRAYAITAEQIDPLFTIDLSDPANPQQIGELEIPGWVYHMETRGDRILALGFDPDNDEGSINVSLFDVSDFAAPALRKRVHFGGDWASFAEDQNRVHKAFSILDDEDMLLVPYSGWEHEEFDAENPEEGEFCYGNSTYIGGVQIIDWLDDDLTLRGVVPSRGRPRRAFTHRDRIVTMSDSQLGAYTYDDRDNPQTGDELALAVHVNNLVAAGDYWVRIGQDWYDSEQTLEIVSGDDPGAKRPIGVIELDATTDPCEWRWLEGIYAHGDHVFLVERSQTVTFEDDDYNEELRVIVTSIDISNPENPQLDDLLELDDVNLWGGGAYLPGVDTQARSVIQHGASLLLQSQIDGIGRVDVVDLSDPANLAISASLERPESHQQGALSVLSDTVVSWHTEPVPEQPGKVRFYFDRLNLDGEPAWAESVNVPGVIVAYDAEAERAYTVDFAISTSDLSEEDCWEHPKSWYFDWDAQECLMIERSLEQLNLENGFAVLEQTIDIEGDKGLESLRSTHSRIFAKIDASSWDWETDNFEHDSELVIVDLANDGAMHTTDGAQFGSWWSVTHAMDDRALVRASNGQLGLVDAEAADAPEVSMTQTPGYSGCWNLVFDGEQAYCPRGPYGVQTLEW